jgi:hypothetical protein
MSAFERETDMRLVGIQAAADRLGNDTTEVFEELRFRNTSVDALLTRTDEDALDERAEKGLDTPLTGAKLGVYQWFARDGARDPEDLLATSPDAEQDQELVDELVADGFLEERDDGTIAAVDVPRHIETVAVEFVADNWRKGSEHPFRSRDFTDEQWLVVDADVVDEAAEATEWFEEMGIGLAALSPDGVITVVQDASADDPADKDGARELAEMIYAGEVA